MNSNIRRGAAGGEIRGIDRTAKEYRLNLAHQWRFLTGYLRAPNTVGALAPSSRALAEALCAPFRRCAEPARVLEVGAGTGAITRHLGTLLGERDQLDICEIRADFVDILRRDVLTGGNFAPAVANGRVRLLQAAVQELACDDPYDFIISCLPFSSFELRDVQEIFEVVRRGLKPDGVFCYFEYIGFRTASRWLSFGRRRNRVRSVSAFLSKNIRDHQFSQRIVVRNFPPATARYLRFNGRPLGEAS